jgi:hypothetical protein
MSPATWYKQGARLPCLVLAALLCTGAILIQATSPCRGCQRSCPCSGNCWQRPCQWDPCGAGSSSHPGLWMVEERARGSRGEVSIQHGWQQAGDAVREAGTLLSSWSHPLAASTCFPEEFEVSHTPTQSREPTAQKPMKPMPWTDPNICLTVALASPGAVARGGMGLRVVPGQEPAEAA